MKGRCIHGFIDIVILLCPVDALPPALDVFNILPLGSPVSFLTNRNRNISNELEALFRNAADIIHIDKEALMAPDKSPVEFFLRIVQFSVAFAANTIGLMDADFTFIACDV